MYCGFQAEYGIRVAHDVLELRRVLFRSRHRMRGDVGVELQPVGNRDKPGRLRLWPAERQCLQSAAVSDGGGVLHLGPCRDEPPAVRPCRGGVGAGRSEEHTSELQSLMRISYAVFCLNKKQLTQTREH